MIEFDGYITEEAIQDARQALTNPQVRQEMSNHNDEFALQLIRPTGGK